MKEIHISIFNPDNLRLNKLYCKLNRYTTKVTADPFEPNMSIENLYGVYYDYLISSPLERIAQRGRYDMFYT